MRYIETILLILTIQIVSAQKINYNLIANYQVKWQVDSTNVDSKVTAENYVLFTGNTKSIFLSSNRLGLDTIIYKGANVGDLQKLMTMPQPSSNKRIIKNLTNNKITVYDEISSTIFQFDEEIKLKWKLHNDTIHMNNIILKKATVKFKGRNYIAWYNNKIGVNDGPYKFKGLPGLIFKIYDTKKHYIYEIINYKLLPKTKHIAIDYNSNSKLTTKKELKKAKNEFRVNPIPLMESEGAVFSEETKRIIRQKFKERRKQNNNPIELKEEDE